MSLTRLGAVLISIVLTGCGSLRPTSPPDRLSCGLDRFIVRDIYRDYFIFKASQIRPESLSDPNPSFNVLALSAGGEFGAYGAGFLNGWRGVGQSAKPSPRDDIQIVTGVSTGAILATHAFLGEDQLIEQIYRSLSGDQIYTARNKLELIWANSLLDASNKDRLIKDNLARGLIDRVATASGRFLYIGIVDLDSGRFLRINMVELAKTIRPLDLRDACYRAVIGASSAIPIAFPPKFIDDLMLTDGGARRHLFITELPDEAKKPNVQRRLFSFVHGDLTVDCITTTNGVLQIAARMADLFTDQGFKDSIRLADALAKAPVSSTSSQPIFSTYYASAAAAATACAPKRATCKSAGGVLSEDMFCHDFMNCLGDQGKDDGRAYASGLKPWLQLGNLDLSSQQCTRSDTVRMLSQ
jgi:predicted acylesterase/phospholipase RssA